MALLDILTAGLTAFNTQQGPTNNPFIPDFIEFGTTGAPPTSTGVVTIDNTTGQVIQIKKCKTRRRRKRLASASDIKDLASLKAILGGGKSLDTWIATRGR